MLARKCSSVQLAVAAPAARKSDAGNVSLVSEAHNRGLLVYNQFYNAWLAFARYETWPAKPASFDKNRKFFAFFFFLSSSFSKIPLPFSFEDCRFETDVSENAISAIYSECRDTVSRYMEMINADQKLGGAGRIVCIDEIHFTKKKKAKGGFHIWKYYCDLLFFYKFQVIISIGN